MALLYFSKLNINSKIYDVYQDDNIRIEILNSIIEKMSQENEIIDTDKVRYKFCDLIKNYDEMYVAGRLVKIFEGENESYNKEKDTVDIIPADDCASHITFYFDVKNEQITFIRRRDFGYIQFNNCFKLLLEQYFDDVEFEVYLEKNIDQLKEKMAKFKQILKVEITIVPPNANDEDFRRLFGTNSEEFKETNATKYTQTLSTSAKNKKGINWRTDFFERMFYGIAKGYGDMSADGKNFSGERYTVTSDEDAPFTRPIPDNEKHSLSAITERGKQYISELISQKIRMELNEKEAKK